MNKIQMMYINILYWVMGKKTIGELILGDGKDDFYVEINGDSVVEYNGEEVNVFRVQYKNMLVYFNADHTPVKGITVYSNDGDSELYMVDVWDKDYTDKAVVELGI